MKKALALLIVFFMVFSVVFADEDPVDLKTDSDFRVQETGIAAVDEDLSGGGTRATSIEDVQQVLEDYYRSQRTELPDIGRPHVALVLSGGGAKGIAHIPIIAELERYGIPIDKVYGTSMGALIGGLYCAGISPKELTEIVSDNDLMSLFTVFESSGYKSVPDAFDYHSDNVISISLGQGIGGVSGLIDDYQVLNFLTEHIGNVPDGIDFDKDLVVPFECNAADMLTGNEVIFNEGNLLTAMRASMSIPVVFEPVRTEDGQILMDGGVVCNYIVHRAVMEGYDIVIVVTLDGYHKNKMKSEQYNSFSGVMGGTLSIILTNVSKGEIELADYWFSPDMTGYGTLSFSHAKEILQRGYDEVEEQQDKFRQIAGLFTEEQKVYKDPDRISEYHTKYKQISRLEHLSSDEARHEDFMGRTRVSIGVYGSGSYGFYFRPEDQEKEMTRRVIYPTLSLRTFLKDMGGFPVSFDLRLKMTVNKPSDLSAMLLYRFTPDSGERVFGLGRVRGTIGSLTKYTDPNEILRFKQLEGNIAADLGVLITNEKEHQLKAYLTADNTWHVQNSLEESSSSLYGFVPSFTVEGVYCPNYSIGYFSNAGSRFDFLGTIGYNVKQKELMYKIGLAAESAFSVSEKVSLWFDFTAFSSKGITGLRSTYAVYGGWDGMPGYSVDVLCADFVYGGFGTQFNLSNGFVSSFLSVVVRGGVRSKNLYGIMEETEFDSMIPFKDSFTSGLWDLGISVGYGVSTPVGDLIFGVGFNKNLQLALYLELT